MFTALVGAASVAGVSLLFGASAPAAPASPPPDVERYLAAASRLYENLEYERALDQLERAQKASNDVETDVTISLYEGIVRAELRQKDEAVAAFKTALFLTPDASLPVRVSPKVRALFEEVRAQVKQQIALFGPPKTAPRANRAPQVAQPPPAARVPVAPLIAAGAAAGALGVGIFFGVQANGEVSAAQQAPFQDDALRHQQAAFSSATGANLCYGAAGVALVAAAILYLTGSR